jgi:hypothetical protein
MEEKMARKKKPTKNEIWLKGAKEIMKRLGVTESTLMSMITKGELESKKESNEICVPWSEIERLTGQKAPLERGAAAPQPEDDQVKEPQAEKRAKVEF